MSTALPGQLAAQPGSAAPYGAATGGTVGFGAQLTGAEWQEGRYLMRILRFCGGDNESGLSWRAMSSELGESNPGYAEAAFSSKHTMQPHTLPQLRKLVDRLRPEIYQLAATFIADEDASQRGETGPVRKTLQEAQGVLTHQGAVRTVRDLVVVATDQSVAAAMDREDRSARAVEIAEWIRGRPGGSWEKVARIFGYHTAQSASNNIRPGGYVGVEKLAQAEKWYQRQLEKESAMLTPAHAALGMAPMPETLRGAVAQNRLQGLPYEPDTMETVAAVAAPSTMEVAAPVTTEPAVATPVAVEVPVRLRRQAKRKSAEPPATEWPAEAKADSWDLIRKDAEQLVYRIQAQAGVPMPGLPAAVVREAQAAIQRRADRLLQFISEELEA